MNLPRKIYAIQHNVTKKIYIGSSSNVDSRYQSHIKCLKAGKHPVEDMQADFDAYGENYSLYVLDEITEHKDSGKEYEYMRKYNTFTRGIGYNYNDQQKEYLYKKNTPPYKTGTPEPFEKLSIDTAKAKYKEAIFEKIEHCADLGLLDLILKILEKSLKQ